MDTNVTIRILNRLTEPHFTSGGHHMMTGVRSLDGLVLAAWYARSALDSQRALDKRVCDLLRAKEEIGKVDQGEIVADRVPELTHADFCNVLNAISWATSLVCDDIRRLEINS